MSNIPTAEEWFKHFEENAYPGTSISECIIEFAKLHVEAALKEAAHRSECYNKAKFPGDENWVVDIESILNAYPLENIK